MIPEDNKDTEDPAKVIRHVEWYAQYFTAVTGRNVIPDDLITMSEAVYKRRGWTNNGIPKVETVRRLGIYFPEVIEVLKTNGVE